MLEAIVGETPKIAGAAEQEGREGGEEEGGGGGGGARALCDEPRGPNVLKYKHRPQSTIPHPEQRA